jgi:membrane-associated phospholipid phosphatase
MSVAVQAARRPVTTLWWSCATLLVAWAALLGMVLTGSGLAADDGPALGWLVQHRSSSLTSLFEAVSSTPLDGVAAALGGALVLLVAVRTRSVWPVITLGAAVAGAVVVTEVVKGIVGRARPATATMLGAPESGPGFPSAHTMVFTALAGAVALVVWRATASAGVRAVAVTGAALASAAMGASRLYLGDHWLTDVLASYALAGAMLTAVAALTPLPRWRRSKSE